MAGQPKRGLDFAAWDVHLFDDDERFDVLIDAQGWDGFGVFFWICTKAYATNGYYYEWLEETSAATIAKRMSGGIKSDTVNQVVKLCLRIGLFDNGLFDRESILTNKMMQERYMYAIEKRSVRGRTINRLYWLLKTEETKAYIVIPENEHNLSENEHNLSENDTKKSKVKESKVKTPSSVDDVVAACATSSPSQESSKVDFINVIGNDKSWLASVAQNMHIGGGMERITSLFNQFRDEQKMVDKVHTSISDSKQHFISWLRIKLRESAGIGRKAARFTATDPNGYEGKF